MPYAPSLSQVVSTSYEGSVDVQGRWDGHGRVSFKSGATYDGTWRAGRMHGHGKFVFPDGISYEGEFQDNQLTGTGVSTHVHVHSLLRALCVWGARVCGASACLACFYCTRADDTRTEMP